MSSSKKIGGNDRKILNVACVVFFAASVGALLSPTFDLVLCILIGSVIVGWLGWLAANWIIEEVKLRHELTRPVEVTAEVLDAIERRREEYARSLGRTPRPALTKRPQG